MHMLFYEQAVCKRGEKWKRAFLTRVRIISAFCSTASWKGKMHDSPVQRTEVKRSFWLSYRTSHDVQTWYIRTFSKRGNYLLFSFSTFKKQHISHCLVCEFQKGSTTTETFKNLCTVYLDVVKVRTCQVWFKSFKNGVCGISEKLAQEYNLLWMRKFWKRLFNLIYVKALEI